MGGNWVLQLAKHHDLWVLTEETRFAPSLKEHIVKFYPELKSAIHIVGIPHVRFGEELWHHFFYYWTYRRWQKEAFKVARQLHRQIRFDLTHQLNMIGFREPGYLWRLGVPFVWGPIGGHAQMPWRFLPILGLKGAGQCAVRNALNWVQMRASWRVKKAVRSAAVLLAATREDQHAISRLHGRTAHLLNEQGTAPTPMSPRQKLMNGKTPLRLVWCGVFVPRKALPLALRVLQLASKTIQVELEIIGSGPMEMTCKVLAERLGVSKLCRWHGMVPRSDALAVIRQSDVMLFTSLQEASATVVFEAIQSGVPVICHDLCGFGTVVSDTCGVKIPAHNPQRSCLDFVNAVTRLARDPHTLRRLSEGAFRRAEEITWSNQTKIMLNCYQRALTSYARTTTYPS